MDRLLAIRKQFEQKKELLERALADARRARAEAPTPTESHSDTTMSEKEKLITALEIDLANINKFLSVIPQAVTQGETIQMWSYVQTDKMKLLIVPDGMGGGQIQDIRLISAGTPLGKAILGKRIGDKFAVNGTEFEGIEG